MNNNNKIKYIAAGIFVTALVGLPILISQTQNRQELKTRASASATLYFTPTASSSSPLKAKVGDSVALDVWLNPGTNLPSIVKLDIVFDPLKLHVSPTGFLANLTAFPTVLEGPVLNNGNLKISLSIGSDYTKAIQTITKVGTITLTALSPTGNTPTAISFGNNTLALSIAKNDNANQNILAMASPAYIEIFDLIKPIPTQLSTFLAVSTYLHGIGASGDNANPTDSRLSNKSPQHLQRVGTAYIFNNQNEFVSSSSGNLEYDSVKGNFSGNIDIGGTIPQGLYTIKIHVPAHLRRLVPGIQTLNSQQNNILPAITLVTGDINNDNTLNIIDYSVLIDCYSDLLPAKACSDVLKTPSDLNDDGAVNQIDYNLFLRELTTQSGN